MQEASRSSYSQMRPQFPEQEHLKCPRCDSPNTKFCYYNNYNLSQPRHFCKNCKRYWTKGGTLRNIPIGGATRKNNKRSSKRAKLEPDPDVVLPGFGVQTGSGFRSFSSLLVNGQFEGISNGLNLNMSEFEHNPCSGSGSGSSLIQNEYENANKESFLGSQNGWNSSNGWPDLAIFTTPGSSFP